MAVWNQFIDGAFVDGTGGKKTHVLDPSINEPVAEVSLATREDASVAIDCAEEAFRKSDWSSNHSKRAKILWKIYEIIMSRHEDLARLEARQTGKPIRETRTDIDGTAKNFEYFSGMCDKAEGSTIPFPKRFVYTLREPYGVITQIIPWNAPLALMARGVAPALAFGNTVVIKGAALAPLTCIEFGRICAEAGIPKGVVNVLTGTGQELGQTLVQHKNVKKVVFTGSVNTGKEVLKMASAKLIPVILELGGKSPMIVFDDVEIPETIDAVTRAAFWSSGQVCFAGTRLFLHESISQKFENQLKERVEKIKLGKPLDESAEMGAIISKEQLDTVRSYIGSAVNDGASIITGGKEPRDTELSHGNFILPTLLTDVSNDMQVCQEEVFGPVLPIMEFSSVDEVVQQANNVEYGLAAFVYTNNLRRALSIAPRLEAGAISIFTFGFGPSVPRGGYKLSGLGREAGMHAVEEYTQIKNVSVGLERTS